MFPWCGGERRGLLGSKGWGVRLCSFACSACSLSGSFVVVAKRDCSRWFLDSVDMLCHCGHSRPLSRDCSTSRVASSLMFGNSLKRGIVASENVVIGLEIWRMNWRRLLFEVPKRFGIVAVRTVIAARGGYRTRDVAFACALIRMAPDRRFGYSRGQKRGFLLLSSRKCVFSRQRDVSQSDTSA